LASQNLGLLRHFIDLNANNDSGTKGYPEANSREGVAPLRGRERSLGDMDSLRLKRRKVFIANDPHGYFFGYFWSSVGLISAWIRYRSLFSGRLLDRSISRIEDSLRADLSFLFGLGGVVFFCHGLAAIALI
jgi:hypothetical protein